MGRTRLRAPIAKETFFANLFVFRPREMGISGNTQKFGLINSLDNLVINFDFYIITLDR